MAIGRGPCLAATGNMSVRTAVLVAAAHTLKHRSIAAFRSRVHDQVHGRRHNRRKPRWIPVQSCREAVSSQARSPAARAVTIGAILLPLIALAVCVGGAWFSWRMVKAASEADEASDVDSSAAPSGEGEVSTSGKNQSTGAESAATSGAGQGEAGAAGNANPAGTSDSVPERSGVHLAGLVVASVAILVGLGGIGYVVGTLTGLNGTWLLVGYIAIVAGVAGALLIARRRHRAGARQRQP